MTSSDDGPPTMMMMICRLPILLLLLLLDTVADGADIFYEWHVVLDNNVKPVSADQPVITINGMFPGPQIVATTNDNIHVNVFNDMDEPLLFTWNGIEQRLNSWQDGVLGTNCPILPGTNWTYEFQSKDQIGSFFYFPSINFQKAAGGFGAIRVNNRSVIALPYAKPEGEFDLLIGDWYHDSYKSIKLSMHTELVAYHSPPEWMLMNGKRPYKSSPSKPYDSFNVTRGKTYLFRISNVGTTFSINVRFQNHRMVLVETEGSYPNQMTLDSLDIHVGQSYSVLVTADQDVKDYYVVATPKMVRVDDFSNLMGLGVLHYENSYTPPNGQLPVGPDPFDLFSSVIQARSIRWNLTSGAARPNPQGSFNVKKVIPSQSFILRGSRGIISGVPRYTVNKVSYVNPITPLKLADTFSNGNGIFVLDEFSTNTSNAQDVLGVFVANGIHKGWIEIVFKNDMPVLDSWHLDGFGFFVVGFGDGEWTLASRITYNLFDPVVRSTVQVYPSGWTAVYAYLDNPGMWNVRSQILKYWYLGQELYIRVFDPDNNTIKEKPPPQNLILCGNYHHQSVAAEPAASPSPTP